MVELELGRRDPQRRRVLVLPPGQPVGGEAGRAEPAQHRRSREPGEVTQGRKTQADQEAGEVVVVENPHRPRRQERRGLPRRHHERRPRLGPPGRQPRCEHPVGDPDPNKLFPVSRVLRRNEEARIYHWHAATGKFPPRRGCPDG